MNWHELFVYEPETGKLFWRITRSNRAGAGSEAGSKNQYGYLFVRVNGRNYQVHRIIWDMFNTNDKLCGTEEIDHIDHNRENNRLDNLRKVCHTDNMRNQSLRRTTKSGATGVSWRERDSRWRAYITIAGVCKHIGHFMTFEEALSARKAAEIKYGFHENHGAKNEAQE